MPRRAAPAVADDAARPDRPLDHRRRGLGRVDHPAVAGDDPDVRDRVAEEDESPGRAC
jgi:hypothetical protein